MKKKNLKNLEESRSKFIGDFRVLEQKDMSLLGLSQASLLSKASSLIPSEFDASKNIDILPIVFNVAVVNKFNANHDGIDTEGAIQILKQFINKPINIEHIKPYIVGHIVNASFSDKQPDFEENDISEFEGRTTPFYITLAGFIYKNIYPELARALIENSDPESEYYQNYASSWEISFSDYKIGVGSEMISECKIYDRESTPEEFASYVEDLRNHNGSGFSKAGQVSRILSGDKYPLGCALTENPAADVKGTYCLSSLIEEHKDEQEDEEDYGEMIDDPRENFAFDKKNNKNEENRVKLSDKENIDFMTDEQFKAFMEAITEAKGGESKASKEIAKQFEDILSAQGTEWKSKAETAEIELKTLKEESAANAAQLAEANEKLEEIKADLSVKESADRFNARMSSVSEAYELSEAEEAIVSDEVRALGEAEADFTKYLAKAAVVFAHRNKETLAAAKNKEGEEKEEKNEDLETEESKAAKILNNSGEGSDKESLIDSLRKSGLELED